MMKINSSQGGISLIELLLVVVSVGFLALLIANLPSSMSAINQSRHASLAREIASKEIDYLRRQTYTNLANSSSNFTDSSLTALPNPLATYEVTDCPLSICTHNERAKQVRVKVSWVESGVNKNVQLTSIIAESGLVK